MERPVSSESKDSWGWKKLCAGLPGAEGPVVGVNGKLYCVAPEMEKEGKPAGFMCHVDLEAGSYNTFAAPAIDGYGGIPAGCQAEPRGGFWVADMRLGILHIDRDGEVHQVATVDAKGEAMQGCNDCAFDPAGNLWVTAPAGPIAPAEYTRSMEKPFGSVYCVPGAAGLDIADITGGTVAVYKVAEGYQFPNGITVSGDGNTLILAETGTKSLWAFDIVSTDGAETSKCPQLSNKRLWAKVPGTHVGGPDGMDFDETGRLLVANWGSGYIEVFNGQGTLVERVQCPFTAVSNVHFQPATRRVFATEHTHHAIWEFQWHCRGQQQLIDGWRVIKGATSTWEDRSGAAPSSKRQKI